jgi:hypothetical protein
MMKKALSMIPAVLAAGLIFAPLAHADGVDEYDQYMIGHGLVSGAGAYCGNVEPCGQSLDYLLSAGRAICNGTATAGDLMGPRWGLGRAQAEDVAQAAHQYLC